MKNLDGREIELVKDYENLIKQAISKFIKELPWQEGIELNEQNETELMIKWEFKNFSDMDKYFIIAEKNIVKKLQDAILNFK